MEWTLEHEKPDTRGNRRYLSLASSPTEDEVRIGVKVGSPPSSFKRKLMNLVPGQKIVAGQLIGDFTMPKDMGKKLVFIAGGIGVTPFRSMVKYLIDTNQRRDIVLMYSAKEGDFVYKDVFDQAHYKLGIKTYYNVGRFQENFIFKEVPDYKNRIFYLSGPKSMVDGFKNTLRQLSVANSQIKTDYFPGFA
jgi:ferredoxin-NADP reductase